MVKRNLFKISTRQLVNKIDAEVKLLEILIDIERNLLQNSDIPETLSEAKGKTKLTWWYNITDHAFRFLWNQTHS